MEEYTDRKRDSAEGRPHSEGSDSSSGARSPAELAALFGEVRTERLVLRRPTPADGTARYMIHGDPATNRYKPHGPDSDLAASDEVLRQWLRQWEVDGYSYWAVMLPASGEVIGFSGVRRMTWRDRDILNLYYRFAPSAWATATPQRRREPPWSWRGRTCPRCPSSPASGR